MLTSLQPDVSAVATLDAEGAISDTRFALLLILHKAATKASTWVEHLDCLSGGEQDEVRAVLDPAAHET